VKDAFTMKKFSYGLIFMDCSMPVMNGYDATEAIRTFTKQKRIL
jgi:CheY-like chemotaxis protein